MLAKLVLTFFLRQVLMCLSIILLSVEYLSVFRFYLLLIAKFIGNQSAIRCRVEYLINFRVYLPLIAKFIGKYSTICMQVEYLFNLRVILCVTSSLNVFSCKSTSSQYLIRLSLFVSLIACCSARCSLSLCVIFNIAYINFTHIFTQGLAIV